MCECRLFENFGTFFFFVLQLFSGFCFNIHCTLEVSTLNKRSNIYRHLRLLLNEWNKPSISLGYWVHYYVFSYRFPFFSSCELRVQGSRGTKSFRFLQSINRNEKDEKPFERCRWYNVDIAKAETLSFYLLKSQEFSELVLNAEKNVNC